MSLQRMNTIVRDELRATPRGARGSTQNQYRAAYQNYRMNSLGRHPIVRSAAEARLAALNLIREWEPGFEPAIC